VADAVAPRLSVTAQTKPADLVSPRSTSQKNVVDEAPGVEAATDESPLTLDQA
jgi:hypothetical protein